MLRRNSAYTAVAALTLALGIGAVSTLFSFVNALILHPYAFQEPERIVEVWETAPQQGVERAKAAPANFRDWQEQARGFDLLAAGHGWNVNLNSEGIRERVEGYRVTADFFAVLGIPAGQGRAIAAVDFQPGHTSVVVLSHGFWLQHFGGNQGILGKSVRLGGEAFRVIGVMPQAMDYPPGVQLWAPLDLTAGDLADRSDHYLDVIGRLKRGATVEQAQASLDEISTQLGRQYPQTNEGHRARAVGLVEDLTGSVGPQLLLVVFGAAAFVLLLACANVANLQLARATSRQQEILTRRALGASRWQIARQLLMESVLLAVPGGFAGLLLAGWGFDLVRRAVPPAVYLHISGATRLARIDSRALVFTLAVTLLTGILAGLAPALDLFEPNLYDRLREGGHGAASGRRTRRLRELLVVLEVALALVLLVGAGLMEKGFDRLLSENPGFDRSHVLTLEVSLAQANYDNAARVRNYYERALQKLQALPGVESAATISSLPGGRGGWTRTEYSAEDQPPAAPGELRLAVSQHASPDCFRVLRVPLVKGRFFSEQDGPDSAPVVIVSESLAHRIWGEMDPIGRRIKMGRAESKEPWRTVVGVVGVIKQFPIDEQPEPTSYVPFAQSPQAATAVILRTTGDPAAMAPTAREAINSLDADQPAYQIQTLEDAFSESVLGLRIAARGMASFSILALALAAAGIFAVLAYAVAERTHEIGVRMALGAQRKDILRLMVGYALRLAVVGVTIGVPCALGMTHALGSVLFGVFRADEGTFAAITLLIVAGATLTACMPARRAMKLDPIVALRHE